VIGNQNENGHKNMMANGKEPAQLFRIERRWPVAIAVLVVILLVVLMPERVTLFPKWLPYIFGIALIVPMATVGLTAEKVRWLRVERTIMLLFIVVTGVGNLANLANLIGAIVRRSAEIGGEQLLTSSIAVWVTNVLTFSLLYWQIDRGGPEDRVSNAHKKPDWFFPQEGAPPEDVPPGWMSAFVDYLYLSYSTATAFSTTEVIPLTSRAKMLMMLESTTSLVTIVVVGARAINILGS
jgi:hypothetical protein